MRVIFNKDEIYKFYIQDEDSDMQDVYQILIDFFGLNEWILDGGWDQIDNQLSKILNKYPMDFILHRFINSNLATIYNEKK